jgi:peroxiredoxin Q/BCP
LKQATHFLLKPIDSFATRITFEAGGKRSASTKKEVAMALLETGDQAPAFELPDQNGKTVRLSDFRGRKLLLYFYPKADTPGCTKQACAVRDARDDLTGSGVAVLGISPDHPEKQKKFDSKYTLGFPLLSDADHVVAEAYGAWGEKSMYGKKYEGIIRSSFLIDEEGRVAQAWYKVSPKDTVPNARNALAA